MANFDDLKATWSNIASSRAKYPFQIEKIGDYIEKRLQPAGINTHAITAVDVRTNQYLFVDSRVEQVTGYTKEEYEDRGPRFMFSKIPLSHKIGVIRSSLHQKSYISKIDRSEVNDLIINREYHVYNKDQSPRRILHQVVEHVFDPEDRLQAIIAIQTQIGHLSLSTKFNYYIFSKSQNKIVYPLKSQQKNDIFTPREKEIILLVSEGLSSEQISRQLYLSLHTVKTHRKNILKKSNASNFYELLHSLNT